MSTKTPKNKPTPKSFNDGESTPSKPVTPKSYAKPAKMDEFCEFFDKCGYCTLGNKCRKMHQRSRYTNPPPELDEELKDEGHEALTEICFSFDVCYMNICTK